MPENPWLFRSVFLFMSPLTPAKASWHPLKNKIRGEKNRSPSFCRQKTLPPSQGTHDPLSVSPSHTHPLFIKHSKVFFDASMLTRTEGDKTQPWIKRQGQSEEYSQIWTQASPGTCPEMEVRTMGPHPACGPTITNQTRLSASSLLCLLCPEALWRRQQLACSFWCSALSYAGRWWGLRENQISRGRSLALNFSIQRGYFYTCPEKGHWQPEYKSGKLSKTLTRTKIKTKFWGLQTSAILSWLGTGFWINVRNISLELHSQVNGTRFSVVFFFIKHYSLGQIAHISNFSEICLGLCPCTAVSAIKWNSRLLGRHPPLWVGSY